MFKQLFATMNDVLDEIMKDYPTADLMKKQELQHKLGVLKSMSDAMIEEWLKFEEKLAGFLEGASNHPVAAEKAATEKAAFASDAFQKGQGYFELFMFDRAIREFEQVVKQHPDFLLARLYLAMGHLKTGNDAEAYRHFKFITSLTEHAKMKAISYNAMGCIQAKNENLEQAQEYFKLAYMADPTCVEPVMNIGLCMKQEGQMKIGQEFIP